MCFRNTCLRLPDNAEISTAALLSYFLITLAEIELENVSFIYILNLSTLS